MHLAAQSGVTMADPITAVIEHHLGREEAVRRIKSGIDRHRGTINNVATIRKELWSGDSLNFTVAALGQECDGTIDVQDDKVRIQIILPGMIKFVGARLLASVQRHGRQLLLRSSR
jgi:hypothetical protein